MLKKLRLALWTALGLVAALLAYRYIWPYLDPRRPHFVVQTTPLRSLEGVLGAGRLTDGAGMYWLDNQRLLAVADLLPHDARPGRYVEPTEKSLYVWNTQSAAYRKYRQLPLHDFSELCHYRGRVWYRSGVTEVLDFAMYWAGQFGSEAEIRMPMHTATSDYMHGNRFLNVLSCNEQLAQESLRPEHRRPVSQANVIWLRQEDGYVFLSDPLDPTHRDNSGYAIYYRADGSAPITLPIPASQLAGAGIDYSEFADEYVITPGANADRTVGLAGARPGSVYVMKPGGTVTEEGYPGRLGLTGNASFPTRAGMFLPRGPVAKPGEYAGAWLFHEGRLYPVEKHTAGTVAVSPDGCKIAFDVRNSPEVVAGTIRIVDLCPS